jgi:hypothetical protein
MKNPDIVNLVNNGILGLTWHDLEPKDAYQVFLFKRAVSKAYEEFKQKRDGIDEKLFSELMDEEVKLEGFKPISWDAYCRLANENKNISVNLVDKKGNELSIKCDPLIGFVGLLENVLWEEPKE